MTALGIGTTGQILTVSGTGIPSWTNAGGSTNYWQQGSGFVAPLNITNDLLLGGTSTDSATFAFIHNAPGSGTPIASISAGVSGGIYLSADGTLATTNDQSLTLGDANTG